MALAPRRTRPSVDAASAMYAAQLAGDFVAGEALDAGAACYIKSDGKIWMSNGTSNNAAAKFFGITPTDYLVGETVTLYGPGTRVGYATGLTPGTPLYVAATAGRFDTGATTGGLAPVAVAVNATDIMIIAQTA